jgi:hypothetical protein
MALGMMSIRPIAQPHEYPTGRAANAPSAPLPELASGFQTTCPFGLKRTWHFGRLTETASANLDFWALDLLPKRQTGFTSYLPNALKP